MHMVKKLLGFVSWFVVGFVALVRGMDMVGYPLQHVQEFLTAHASLVKPIGLFVLISGAWSLLTMLGMILGFSGCRGCSCKCAGSCSK